MLWKKILVALAVCAAPLAGCSTITTGAYQTIEIVTDPPGATVRIAGEAEHRSPVSVQLPRREDAVVTITKPGYRTETYRILSVIGGDAALTLIRGGVVGGAVDMATGAAFKLVPERLSVLLTPMEGSTALTTIVKTSPVTPSAPTPAAGEPAGARTASARLRDLQKLHDEKLITDAEYLRIRSQILTELAGVATPTAVPSIQLLNATATASAPTQGPDEPAQSLGN